MEYFPLPEFREPPKELLALDQGVDDLWFHGTGRFKMVNGETFDVLEDILTSGLKPQPDHLAKVLLTESETISLASDRLYARCYAERFGGSDRETSELIYACGAFEEWESYFYGTTKKIAAENWKTVLPYLGIRFFRNLSRFSPKELLKIANVPHHEALWNSRKTSNSGNFPCIFGIDIKGLPQVELCKGISAFEARISQVITPDRLHVLEVPQKFLQEVKNRVENSIEVVAIERAEAASYQKLSAGKLPKRSDF